MKIASVIALTVSFLALAVTEAQVPLILNYQGRVAMNGTNFDGVGQFHFALVNGTSADTIWSNGDATVSLPVTTGLYSVFLGDTNLANMAGIPATLFTNSDVRLRVWFDGGEGLEQLLPDQRLSAVGYAVIASTVADGAITSNKLAAGAVTAAAIADGAVGAAQLGSNMITAANIASNTITAAQLSDQVWTASEGATLSNRVEAVESSLAASSTWNAAAFTLATRSNAWNAALQFSDTNSINAGALDGVSIAALLQTNSSQTNVTLISQTTDAYNGTNGSKVFGALSLLDGQEVGGDLAALVFHQKGNGRPYMQMGTDADNGGFAIGWVYGNDCSVIAPNNVVGDFMRWNTNEYGQVRFNFGASNDPYYNSVKFTITGDTNGPAFAILGTTNYPAAPFDVYIGHTTESSDSDRMLFESANHLTRFGLADNGTLFFFANPLDWNNSTYEGPTNFTIDAAHGDVVGHSATFSGTVTFSNAPVTSYNEFHANTNWLSPFQPVNFLNDGGTGIVVTISPSFSRIGQVFALIKTNTGTGTITVKCDTTANNTGTFWFTKASQRSIIISNQGDWYRLTQVLHAGTAPRQTNKFIVVKEP